MGDPYFQDGEYWLLKKFLHGLRRSPHHWYNMTEGIILDTRLNPSPHDPCLLSGVITNPSSLACTSDLQYQLHVRLYVYEFLFYLYDTSQEELLKTLVQDQIQVEYMGNID